jgi:hypothetical protein
MKMVNEACSYPKTSLDDMYQIDADLEMEKLPLLIKIDTSEYPLRTRAPAAMQSNTDILASLEKNVVLRRPSMAKHYRRRPSHHLTSLHRRTNLNVL